MRAPLVALALVLSGPAQAQTGVLDWGYCRLWPSKCVPPVAAPIPAPPPEPVPLPPALTEPAVKPPAPPSAPQAKPVRVKPKWKPAPQRKRDAAQRVVVPSWCSWVPAGTSVDRMRAEAKSRGIAWTPQAERQARACLASK